MFDDPNYVLRINENTKTQEGNLYVKNGVLFSKNTEAYFFHTTMSHGKIAVPIRPPSQLHRLEQPLISYLCSHQSPVHYQLPVLYQRHHTTIIGNDRDVRMERSWGMWRTTSVCNWLSSSPLVTLSPTLSNFGWVHTVVFVVLYMHNDVLF